MKILFIVQGEGRGHLTQAISLRQILEEAGHTVSGAVVGVSKNRKLPAFFEKQIETRIYQFQGPEIFYNADGKGMNLGKTILNYFRNFQKYLHSLRQINQVVEEIKPDLIVSFYEIYSGLYNVIYRSKIPMICIAHQYLLLHPRFTFPENSHLNRFLINFNSRVTSLLSVKKLALSFRSIQDAPAQKIKVVPPLLRKEVRELKATNEHFFLVYMTHHSLSQQIIAWHKLNPETRLHCFWDNKNEPEELCFDATLTFHQINSEKYLRLISSCEALVTTAGFESVCEAMYLGKPVMMVPVPNHFEQECNAIDGVISGAGVTSKTFDLSVLLDYLPRHEDHTEKFREWYAEGKKMFLDEIGVFDKNPSGTVSKRDSQALPTTF